MSLCHGSTLKRWLHLDSAGLGPEHASLVPLAVLEGRMSGNKQALPGLQCHLMEDGEEEHAHKRNPELALLQRLLARLWKRRHF